MVRTRRQAARQPEPPTHSGSDSDSDIPASGRRSRADASRLGTLRPPTDGHPKLLLDPKKRRAAAQAQVASQIPSEAKKRRREPDTAPSTAKRSKTLSENAVNPVVLASMDQFNKKARGTTQAAQAPQMRRITVEIPRSRARGRTLRTVPEGQVPVEEGNTEPNGGLAEEEPEGQPEEEAEQELEQTPAPSRAEPQPKVGQKRNQSKPAEDRELGAGELPRSGQGFQQEASSQRITRKHKPRVPKPAINERPSEDEPVRNVSKSTGAAPGPSEQPHAPATSAEQVSKLRHLQELFYNERSSPRGATASIFIEGDSSDDDEVVGGLDEATSDMDASDPVPDSSPSIQSTVQVPSKDVKSLCYLMGTKAWTARGRGWARVLSDPKTLKHEPPPTTPFAKKVLQLVVVLRKDYRKAPQALSKQKLFLQEREERTEKAFAEITHHIDQKYEEFYAAIERDDKNQVKRSHLLKADILEWVIPILVLLLRDFFLLGGSSEDSHGDRALPEKAGSFTARTLQLLRRTASRICHLAAIIRHDTEMSEPRPASDDDDEEGEVQLVSHAREPRDILRKKLDERTKQRISVDDTVRRFLVTLSKAKDKLDEDFHEELRQKERMERETEEKAEKARKEREALERRRERQKRAEEEQAARQLAERAARERRQRRAEEEMARRRREEEEDLAKRQRRYEAFCLATQRLRDEIEPASSMSVTRRREENGASRLAAAGKSDLADRGRMRSPDLGFFDEAPRVHHHTRQVHGHELSPLPWDDGHDSEEDSVAARLWLEEESLWLLKKLRQAHEPNYDSWAEALERSVGDVRQEAARLKKAVRKGAAEARKRVPAWAQY